MNKPKYKTGDILTDKHGKDKYWSIYEVLAVYNDDDLGLYYWLKNLYYNSEDSQTVACNMDIHSETYMELVHFRKLRKNENAKLLAIIL